jgi:hypothetical protein
MNLNLKAVLPHVWVVLFFILISFIYCSPIIQGKVPFQSDVIQAISGQRELVQYKKADGSTPLWTNSMFGGMPAYQVGGNMFQANIMGYVTRFFTTVFPNPVFLIFLYLLGGYILFLVLDFEPVLAAAGAIAIAFSTYNFTIIDSGHINKALAIAFFAPIVAGILASFRGKYIWGGLLIAFFLAWEIRSNHPQMTYYLFFSLIILGLVEIYIAFKDKAWKNFLWASISIVLGVVLAVGINITSLLVNAEYAQESNRGNTELTLNKDEPKTGLSKEYAYAWSQGIGECITFLIPNGAGGASGIDALDQNSESAKQLSSHNSGLEDLSRLPIYWGPKSFTSGPYYFGAMVFFFFILGLVMVKSPLKWWLLASTLLSIVLSWGKHFQGFSDFFFEHVPLYNKFRAVESILVIADLCVPILGFIALKQVLDQREEKQEVWKKVKYTFFGLGGLLVLLALIPNLFFDFKSPNDGEYKLPEWLLPAIQSDRAGLFRADAIRSLIFIALTVGVLWLSIENRIKKSYVYILLGSLILVDMWGVDKRFFNDKKFVPKSQNEDAYLPTPQDEEILRDSSLDYRVYDAREGSPFLNAHTSYFHKSIGGYHAAKLKRYDELIEFQMARNNAQVLNMLNTKYFILNDSAKGPVVRQNPNALGNAWFVSSVEFENTADQEMNALTGFDPKEQAIINRSFQKSVNILKVNFDSSAKVILTNYRPDDLLYKYNSAVPGLIIFSEIYYPKGWNAYLDGKISPFFRADYVLRGMQVPAGNHTIEFKFEPSIYYTGEKISGISSILMILLILGSIYYYYKKGPKIPGFVGLPNDDDFTGSAIIPDKIAQSYKNSLETKTTRSSSSKIKDLKESKSSGTSPVKPSAQTETKLPKTKPTNITPKKKGR